MLRYEPATWVTQVGTCQPGAKALMAHASSVGLSNVGCYNDRAVRGASAPSLHREGRAVDLTIGARDDHWLGAYVDRLRAKHLALGVQMVIWQRRYWRCDRGDGWHPYGGVDPHTSHAHVELTWGAAARLTFADIAAQFAPLLPPVGTEPEDDDMYFVKAKNLDGSFAIFHVYREVSGRLVKRHVPGTEWATLRHRYEALLTEVPYADLDLLEAA